MCTEIEILYICMIWLPYFSNVILVGRILPKKMCVGSNATTIYTVIPWSQRRQHATPCGAAWYVHVINIFHGLTVVGGDVFRGTLKKYQKWHIMLNLATRVCHMVDWKYVSILGQCHLSLRPPRAPQIFFLLQKNTSCFLNILIWCTCTSVLSEIWIQISHIVCWVLCTTLHICAMCLCVFLQVQTWHVSTHVYTNVSVCLDWNCVVYNFVCTYLYHMFVVIVVCGAFDPWTTSTYTLGLHQVGLA